MSKASIYFIVFTMMSCSISYAAKINIRVETDRPAYKVGDTVAWTIYAWASKGDNRGVAMLSANLDDDKAETLEPPLLGTDPNEFKDTDYGVAEGFQIFGYGTPVDESPHLQGIIIMQWPSQYLDVGNDGDPNLVFAKGVFAVTKLNQHTLTAIIDAANYWPNPDGSGNAQPFELGSNMAATFDVFLRADINMNGCVDVADLTILCEQWLQPPDDPSADIAPIGGDDFIDLSDFALLSTQWLMCIEQ